MYGHKLYFFTQEKVKNLTSPPPSNPNPNLTSSPPPLAPQVTISRINSLEETIHDILSNIEADNSEAKK